MKNLLPILTILLFVQGCKEDDCKPAAATPSIQLINSAGSYWIYDWYSIDKLGNEKYLQTDSIYIAGDSMINGNSYVFRKGRFLSGNMAGFLRDSIGFVVNEKGDILWNKNSIGIFRASNESQINLEWSMTSLSSNITVPAGTFSTLERTTKACYNNGQPLTPCDTCQEEQVYFSEGIGLVLDRTTYIGIFDCSRLEGRLTKYHIE